MDWERTPGLEWIYEDDSGYIEGGRLNNEGTVEGNCAYCVLSNFPYDYNYNQQTHWNYLCEVLTTQELINENKDYPMGTTVIFSLSTKEQKKMIELVEACPYIRLIDQVRSRHGNYLVNLYKVVLC